MSTNSREEFLSLWGLIWFTRSRELVRGNFFRYCKLVIDWGNDRVEMHCTHMDQWIVKIQSLIKEFEEISS